MRTPPRGVPAAEAFAVATTATAGSGLLGVGAPPQGLGTPGDAAPPDESEETPAAKRRRRMMIAAVAALILIGLLLVINFVFLSGGPSYSVSTTGVSNAQGNHVVALWLVRNTGSGSGTPTCTVRLHGDGFTTKTVTLKETKPVAAGKVRLYAHLFTLPDTKASLVRATNVQATCT